MYAPREAATPARTAAPLPWLDGSRITRWWGSGARSLAAVAAVAVGAAVVDHQHLGGVEVDGTRRHGGLEAAPCPHPDGGPR